MRVGESTAGKGGHCRELVGTAESFWGLEPSCALKSPGEEKVGAR